MASALLLLTLLLLGRACGADLAQCRPVGGIREPRCDALMRMCNPQGAAMKWTGDGCTVNGVRLGDGGCQCEGYCGYKCPAACNRDGQCTWAGGKCKVKDTGAVGGPILDCRDTTPQETRLPTNRPSKRPTRLPSRKPSRRPTNAPTKRPTRFPTTLQPTQGPTTLQPTLNPTPQPTRLPTQNPTLPTPNPTQQPTLLPTLNPTQQPTLLPTLNPTQQPTLLPTPNPTQQPTPNPTRQPTLLPTLVPTVAPTVQPTLVPTPAPTLPWIQQGSKLVGTPTTPSAAQGFSVGLSMDGTTLISGGYIEENFLGAAWIFVRSPAGVWTQQAKLAEPSSLTQGRAVDISSDGNTAIIGAPFENGEQGAAYIWVRNSGSWSQYGNKLIGSPSTAPAFQGYSVAISGDGLTALSGANAQGGVAWVFVYGVGQWTQQDMLQGTDSSLNAALGTSVDLSHDGNTAVVGGPADQGMVGAVWIFVRTGTTWAQQGSKLTRSLNAVEQGTRCALSGDGNLVAFSATSSEAAYIYTRSGGIWTYQATLIDTSPNAAASFHALSLSADGESIVVGAIGGANVYVRQGVDWFQQGGLNVGTNGQFQGYAVAMSGDGKTFAESSWSDNSNMGAVWVFVRNE